MKIKLLMLSEDEIEKGFDISIEYPVDKVNVSGDYVAYDIWYHVTNDKGMNYGNNHGVVVICTIKISLWMSMV